MITSVEKNYFEGKFSGYKITYKDNSYWIVPLNSENRHYQEIQKWISEGGTVIDNGGNN